MQEKEAILISQMTSLRSFLQKNGGEDHLRALTGFLSTFYGLSMVAQGHMALASARLDEISKCRSKTGDPRAREYLWVNLSDAMEAILEMSRLSGDVSDLLSEQS